MHLERLEIQGFKSFANKNLLIFPDPKGGRKGITSVVGPNGSGKSNIADAIRWVLGEQSMKTLRGKKSEDVIFSGSDKKGKLGMAEVSLFLNNHGAGTKEAENDIEYSQIVLTRRLFRDGESEYLLNGTKARLFDIQMLLAKAKFGQRTYSVIGQGTVEGFLNTSLAERKEFFDEATGVKQFQIKRDDSLNKLRASYENLSRARMLLDEIAPRLKMLTRQVEKLKKRDEIEKELKELEHGYFGHLWQEINAKFSEHNKGFLEIEKEKKEKEKKLEVLNREHGQLETKSAADPEADGWQKRLGELQAEKDKIVRELARIEAQAQVKLEASGKFDLAWMLGKIKELRAEGEKIGNEKAGLESGLIKQKDLKTETEKELAKINEAIKILREKISELNRQAADSGEGKVNEKILKIVEKIKAAEEAEDLSLLKKLINEIRKELEKILGQEEKVEAKALAEFQEELEEKFKAKGELTEAINKITLEKALIEERLKLSANREKEISAEVRGLEDKVKKAERPAEEKEDYAARQKELEERLEKINTQAAEIKEKIEVNSRAEEEERRRLFKIQRSIQDLQNEINHLNNRLGEIRVAAARYETRLEDLEKEIRQSTVDIVDVKKYKAGAESAGAFDAEGEQIKINSLKRQLEMIGGLDPEIEKDYLSTKEKYDFLNEQVTDLSQAIQSLEKIVRELDINIKERFDKEFKIISGKFEEYFKILFNGGNAKIVKVMESEMPGQAEETGDENEADGEEGNSPKDGATKKVKKSGADELAADINKIKFLQKHNATGLAGIEIQATPPGKKIRSISMLSGGERALTAIALICAIISANPSPFVVLDEVDAALDEANSERLAKILDDLSHKTQFIVITHNRASMRRANILYGVTMQNDGVSKLLSVKLEEAVVNAGK